MTTRADAQSQLVVDVSQLGTSAYRDPDELSGCGVDDPSGIYEPVAASLSQNDVSYRYKIMRLGFH